MRILLDFNTSINKQNYNKLGGIESLNIGLFNNLKNTYQHIALKYRNKKVSLKNQWDVIISSNNARVFNRDKKQKYILWIHNKIQIEKAIRKRQLIPILSNDIHAVFVSKYLERVTSKIYNFKSRNIIPNFLDKKFEDQKLNFKRKPMFIWSVQRDEGLNETIGMWIKTIQKNNSFAELHVFGIKNFKIYKNLEKNNIFFHGRVNKNILIKFYKKSMAMICLGYDETFCLNAIESMSCGLPILSFKKTALNDLIKDNINGYKVDDFHNLSKKIIFLMNMDKKKRIKIINKTYKYSQKFYFKNIKNKWISLISK
jgi:glycosyltransferase involved in cell wall biosynthesis